MFCPSWRGPDTASSVVVEEVGVEVGLHLLDGLVPLLAALDAEVVVEQGRRPPLRGDAGARRCEAESGAPLDWGRLTLVVRSSISSSWRKSS